MTHPVFELRQYLLHPTRREALIELFDREFLETQEARGMEVVGQFRDEDRPDHFVWLRGFASVEERAPALTAFYDGPVWQRHRDAANATMILSDDVLMLKPAWAGAATGLRGNQRPAIGERAPASRIDVVVQPVALDETADFVERFRSEYRKTLGAHGAELLGAMVSDHSENAFPRLPVREGENVFVWIARAGPAPDQAAVGDRTGEVPTRMQGFGEAQRLRLAPTSRSRLR